MDEYLSSSEAFAKALKGIQVSPSEKIRLAREAWQRKEVTLPHKQEFLFEWLCTALLKASTPTKCPQDTLLSVLLDLEYWSLFKDMISQIAHDAKMYRDYELPTDVRSGFAIVNHQTPAALLRISVVPIFTALIQQLTDPSAPTPTSVDSSKRRKNAAALEAPGSTDSIRKSPSVDVLQAASYCFDLLSSPPLSKWFQPTLEQFTPLVQATLDALIQVAQAPSDPSMEKQRIMVSFACIILDRFQHLIVIQPNQRKVFGVVAGKMFEALVMARTATRNISGSTSAECQLAMNTILRMGLFHHEHLQEYTVGYTMGGEKSIQSYQKQLFEQITNLIKSEHSTAVLDVLPVLLRYFVEETRRKQRNMANGGSERGIDNAHETEFSFFKIIYVLARKQLPELTENPSEASVGELANIMDAHNRLLSTILDLNMYQPSNDETTDQFVFMSTSFGSVYSCLQTAQALSQGNLQSISLTGIVVLAQLDDRLLKSHLDSLWSVLLYPLPGADCAALEMAKVLLEIYGKASDLKVFLTSLFSSLRDYTRQPRTLESSPLFSKTFLDLVPINIRNYLPVPQVPGIIDIFATELIALDSSMGIESLEPIHTFGFKKKRKLGQGKSQDIMDNSDHISSAEPITALLIQFLKGLRTTPGQEKQLNKEFSGIYDHYLKGVFEALCSNRDGRSSATNSESYQHGRLKPALELHYALCRISTQYWTSTMSLDLIENVVATFQNTSGWADPIVLTLNRVVLQHVHLTLCTTGMSDGLVQRCRNLVQFTMTASRLARLLDESCSLRPWDGRLGSAFGDRFLVASWQIQVNDWFDIVCRFGASDAMELIARVITMQLKPGVDLSTNASPTGSVTIRDLVQITLRSADFYEVPNFRPIFVQNVMARLSQFCVALSHTTPERSLANRLSSVCNMDTMERQSKDATLKSAISGILTELVEVTNIGLSGKPGRKLKVDSRSSGDKELKDQACALLSLLSIIHLLPLEYFEKYERNVILVTMALLDYFVQQRMPADATGIKCLLLARRIANAIMTFRGDAGVLIHDPSISMTLLNYTTWACSSNFRNEDKDNIGQALMNITCSMVEGVVKIYDAVQYESANRHFHSLLQTLQGWVKESSYEYSNMELDYRISESHVRTSITSHVCQSLVHCLEQYQSQRSKNRKPENTLTAKANSDMETQRALLFRQIEDLFDAVQLKMTLRIRRVFTLLNKPSSQSGVKESEGVLINEAQQCMDQFELYGTISQFRQLQGTENEDNDQCLGLVPDLFHLAKTLTRSITNHDPPPTNLTHLIAILSGYSCQYLPRSKVLQSTEDAERILEELLEQLFTITDKELLTTDATLLKDAYISMLNSISGDQFDYVLDWLLEKPYVSREHAVDDLVILRYIEATFLSAHHTQKRKVRRQVSRLLTRLVRFLQSTRSVMTIVSVLDIMASICSEPSFELRTWEIGLVLEGIASLMSPSTPLILYGVRGASLEAPGVLTNQDTMRIFTAVYHVLISIARFRQEELTTLIPVYTTILQGILHGFKSLNASIAKRQQGVETLARSPFMLLSAGTIDPVIRESGTQSSGSTSVPIGDPLPVECAENYARLLTALGSKGVSTSSSHGSSGTPLESSSSQNTTVGSSSASISVMTDASKAFGKHAPYILLEYLTIQCSVVASISQQSLRTALLPGLYALLDLCGDWEREMMMAGLDNTGKVLLKGLYADYLKYFKYTGR
ncbi:hypothetical protein BGX31_010922 [Mortierella sp. GBA43]|nr:hypothetical protein BGX31_010922 [Mortierella sp. GBA43]